MTSIVNPVAIHLFQNLEARGAPLPGGVCQLQAFALSREPSGPVGGGVAVGSCFRAARWEWTGGEGARPRLSLWSLRAGRPGQCRRLRPADPRLRPGRLPSREGRLTHTAAVGEWGSLWESLLGRRRPLPPGGRRALGGVAR